MKRKLLIFALLAAAFGVSCSRDGSSVGGDPVNGGFYLKCNIPETNATTRVSVEAEPGETEVHALHLLFFKADGDNGFIESYDASPTGMNPLDMSSPIKVDFPVTSQLNNSTPYKILVVANVDSYVQDVDMWLSSFAGLSYDEAVMATKIRVEGASDNSKAISSSSLLMSAATEKTVSQNIVEVTLDRSVARYDVKNNAAGYELVSASIWNATSSTSLWDASLNDYSSHTERYYGVAVTGDLSKGALYSFENYVVSPKANDEQTTCLILGIKKSGDTNPTYYRVNISANSMGQYLKRNYVYNVTVNRVLDYGAANETDAYTSAETLLNVDINNWNMDNEGLILFDGENVLALPVNKVVFTPLAETRTYEIFAYSPTAGLMPYISKSELPAGITASLMGKSLTITAEASADTKDGYIEISFGALKGVISVSQTGQFEEFLELSVGTNGIPEFGNGSGLQWGGNAKVTSSGAWTARIYSEGFTFQSGSNVTTKAGNTGDTFTVSTFSQNTSADPRYAFIIVSLDSNPDISKVLVLSQAGTGSIDISPSQAAVTFSALGDPVGNNSFTVDPGNGVQWTAALTGANASKFIVSPDSGMGSGSFTVTATNNTEASALSATLRVYMTNTPTVAKTISITQQVHTLTLNPVTVAAIPSAGGSTQDITVTSSRPWTATISTTEGVVATLNNTNGANGGTFKVTFPKLTIPNVTPVATVTVTVAGTSVSKTLTVTQTRMVARNITIVTGRPGNYDSWVSPATSADQQLRMARMRTELQSEANFGSTASSTIFCGTRTFTAANPVLSPDGADIFLSNTFNGTSTQASAIRTWLQGRATNVLIVTNHYPEYVAGVNDLIGTWSYTGVSAGLATPSSQRYSVTGSSTASKIHEYLLKTGPFTNGTEINGMSFRVEDAIAGALTAWPPTFIPVIMHPTNTNRCVFGIDPTRRIVYVGDPEIFGTYLNTNSNWSNASNLKFLQNVCAWMINVTQYGSEFADQFK